MRRKLGLLALGVAALIAITWLGTFVTNYEPQHATAQIQTSQAGSYTVTLQVDPNPPSIQSPITLLIQVQDASSHQPINHLTITLNGSMDMGMSTSSSVQPQGDGRYIAHVELAMSGNWTIQLHIHTPGKSIQIATFQVSPQ